MTNTNQPTATIDPDTYCREHGCSRATCDESHPQVTPCQFPECVLHHGHHGDHIRGPFVPRTDDGARVKTPAGWEP